jgi:hypothetical protein
MKKDNTAEIVVMDIDVPKNLKNEISLINRRPEEERDQYHDTFRRAFTTYCHGLLPSYSAYKGVMVKMKVGNSEPVWVVMNERGLPDYAKVPENHKISFLRDLEFS